MGVGSTQNLSQKTRSALWYSKGSDWTFNRQFRPYKGDIGERLTAVKGIVCAAKEGAGVDDWWDKAAKKSSVRQHMKTQVQHPKTGGLLKRIINGHSNKGDLVADFFCGSGTTGAVAEKLGRRWIMADASRLAFKLAYKRLLAQYSKPFISQAYKDPLPSIGRLKFENSVTRSSRGLDIIKVELIDYHVEDLDSLFNSIKVSDQ